MTDALLDDLAHLPPATRAATICEAFQLTVAGHAALPAFAARESTAASTFGDYASQVRAVAAAFAGYGLGRGDTVALMLTNRPEFHWLDTAAMHLGVAITSIYNTAPPNLLEHVVRDSGARFVVTEQAFADRFDSVLAAGLIDLVVVIDGPGVAGRVVGWNEFLAAARPDFDFEATWRSVGPEDVACLVYTSGTTGDPKGVELTHRNVMFLLKSLQDRCRVPFASKQLSFLPMAHMMARIADHYMQIGLAFEVSCCPDPAEVGRYLPIVRPSFFGSTPRLFEKLRAGIMAAVSSMPDAQRTRTESVLAGALAQVRARQEALRTGASKVPEVALDDADRELLSSLAAVVGLDRTSAAIIGGAPVAPELVEFFLALGVPLGEAYGVTESGAAATANPPDRIRCGTVGPALPGVELRLAEDGEILLRCDGIMKGYRNNPAATAAAVTADGWLQTGDIGVLDPDGYVRIVDRKKEIIINAAGKNMSPAHIEEIIKRSCDLLGNAVVIGDGRRYNVAILVPEPESLLAFADRAGIAGTDVADLVHHPEVARAIAEGIDRANEQLIRVEQIKKYQVLEEPWLPGGDELTPTMKIRRRAISAKYDALIGELYSESGTHD
ncbi:AMP-dependent synthetase/ligase [Nocardia sp. NPDC059246]|uniref:AMP-dependent synthetase/ligase n=1 Tax=unclassified Nocardia TaxID=2637762 RepID=UPI0036B67BD0